MSGHLDPASGWFSCLEEAPGPPEKTYTEPCTAEEATCHSMEGWIRGSLSRMLSMERQADGRFTPYAAASWPVSLPLVGVPLQHYGIWQACWTSGSRKANVRSFAFEAEGVAGQPLNANQRYWFNHLMRDVEEVKGFPYLPVQPPILDRVLPWRTAIPRRIYQHNEQVARFGGGATACASDRYTQAWEELMAEHLTMHRLAKATFGADYESRIAALADNVALEGRVSRFESNDGPIGQRLTAIEGRRTTGGGDVPTSFEVRGRLEVVAEED
jgi:hypothetical protein